MRERKWVFKWLKRISHFEWVSQLYDFFARFIFLLLLLLLLLHIFSFFYSLQFNSNAFDCSSVNNGLWMCESAIFPYHSHGIVWFLFTPNWIWMCYEILLYIYGINANLRCCTGAKLDTGIGRERGPGMGGWSDKGKKIQTTNMHTFNARSKKISLDLCAVHYKTTYLIVITIISITSREEKKSNTTK